MLGIDVSKDKPGIAVRPGGEVFAASRDAAGLDAVIPRLAPCLRRWPHSKPPVSGRGGLPVAVVNPAQVRAFARALGKRAKTASIDIDGGPQAIALGRAVECAGN